ncbi:MAG: sodium/pantothenate symporter [Candidatus Arsenophonus melophagi]|nr:sodium/pantothenate symporter [Candidatus Arsenophonus melophagi]
MQIEILLPFIGYLLLVFLLSVYAYRRRQKGEFLYEYFLDNRSMGGVVLAMTITATYISASSFIGGPGAAYKYGLGWVLLALIQVPNIWLSLGVLGKKFAILARRYNAVTLNDMLYARFQSRFLVCLASISLLISFFCAMTVQFIGGARLLETAINIPYEIGLLIFGISIGCYTAFGGFRASVLNDTLQGFVMLLGTIILLAATIHRAGGLTVATEALKAIDPNLIAPQGADDLFSIPFIFSLWVLICFGVIGLPNIAIRCISYKNSQAMHHGIIIGTIVMVIIILGMHVSGALSRAILPTLTIPDQVIPTLFITILPPFAAGIFLAAPIAAIMSTINSNLLQASATIIKDLYLNVVPFEIKKQKKLNRIANVSTFIFSLLLLIAAWRPPKMIIWLNLLAFGGLQAVFFWPLIFGLYWKRANSFGALSSMIIGALSYILMIAFDIKISNFHHIIPSLSLSLMAFLIGNFFGEKFLSITME